MALYQQHVESESIVSDRSNTSQRTTSAKSPEPPEGSLLAQVLTEATKGKFEKAISLSNKQGGQNLDVVNARGVCLMRTGKFDQAIILFRNLVLQPGCTWMRKDRPAHYKTNFATALLMGGHPSGCLEILNELDQESLPTVPRLRSAIKQWESKLSFWSWCNWKLCHIEPSNCSVALDFEPGDFGFEITTDTPPPASQEKHLAGPSSPEKDAIAV